MPSPPRLNIASTAQIEPVAVMDADPAGLTDASLLSVLLAGSPRSEARLARAIIDRFGGLGTAVCADPSELRRTGASEPQVHVIRCLRETTVRIAREEACRRPVISSWSQLVAYVRTAIACLPREQFRTLYLDKRNILLRDEWLADDPTVQAAVDYRIEKLLDATAARIVAGQAREKSTERFSGPDRA
jgi:DNA repair protein RadC